MEIPPNSIYRIDDQHEVSKIGDARWECLFPKILCDFSTSRTPENDDSVDGALGEGLRMDYIQYSFPIVV